MHDVVKLLQKDIVVKIVFNQPKVIVTYYLDTVAEGMWLLVNGPMHGCGDVINLS